MEKFSFLLLTLREPRKPEPPDALVELVVGAIAAGYPGGILQEASFQDSGRIRGHFIDERLNKTFEFEIKEGFRFKPSK